MLSIAPTQGKRTYTDDLPGTRDRLFFGATSQTSPAGRGSTELAEPTHREPASEERARSERPCGPAMELAVSWSGRERSFDLIEFSMDEIVVSGFRVDDLDLCHHEATIDFCDGELLDEVTCRVVFRGYDSAGVARLRIVTNGYERKDLARFADMLRARIEETRALERACLAAACGWL